MRFNPFSKLVAELSPADLAVLNNVQEGWYVEYKQLVPNARSIAKSISSFANHYGGWLVYGVARHSTHPLLPGSFVGIPSETMTAECARIRDAVRTCLSPAPYFELKQLDGPVVELGLPSGHSVIVVQTPLGLDAPYVHASGAIYRRVADASEPKPETDRLVLDNLWQRGRDLRKRLVRLLRRRPVVSKPEENNPYCHLYLVPDLLAHDPAWSAITFPLFREVLGERDPTVLSVMYDNFFSSNEGYVARCVGLNAPAHRVLTWEQSFSGRAFISVPLATRGFASSSAYGNAEQFRSYLSENEYGEVVDLNVSMLIIVLVLAHYRTLRTRVGARGRFYGKLRLDGVWRRLPFVDAPFYTEFVAHNGIPRMQYESVMAPYGDDLDSLVSLDAEPVAPHTGAEALGHQIVAAVPLIHELLTAFGIPLEVLLDKGGELAEALLRAREHSTQEI